MLSRAVDAIRWRRTLASCKLDPSHLPDSLAPPSNRDFFVAGCPRTGTSLIAAVLFQPPEVVTVMEPWDGLRLPPRELFRSLRNEIATGKLERGRLDLDAKERGNVGWHRDQEVGYHLEVSDEFALGVKWPTYWQYLPMLPTTKFVVTVRHPAEVMSSFARQAGRLGQGLDYDVAFNREMNQYLRGATEDVVLRRILLYEYVNSRIIPYLGRGNVFLVRYERWFDDPEGLLTELAEFLEVAPLQREIELRRPERRSLDERTTRLIRENAPSVDVLGYDV